MSLSKIQYNTNLLSTPYGGFLETIEMGGKK